MHFDNIAPSKFVSHPTDNPYFKIYEWQIRACDYDICAAAILAYIEFEYNKIAENHKPHHDAANLQKTKEHLVDEEVLIKFKLSEARKWMQNLFADKKISNGLDKAKAKRFISIHHNPEKICDHTKYIQFYPDVCNAWIRSNYDDHGNPISSHETNTNLKIQSESDKKKSSIRPKGVIDSAKKEDRFGQKALSILPKGRIDSAKKENRFRQKGESEQEIEISFEKDRQVVDFFDYAKREDRFRQKGESIPPKGVLINNLINNNNNNKYNNKLINKINCKKINQTFIDPNQQDPTVHERNVVTTIRDALISEGFSLEEINKPYAIATIESLLKEGATLEIFVDAYAISFHTTQSKGRTFNITYLAKTVRSLLEKSKEDEGKKMSVNTVSYKKTNSTSSKKTYVFENDLENARSWAGDLI